MGFSEQIRYSEDVSLSAKTIKDRTIEICSNIATHHIENMKLALTLSRAVDESCDINDTLHFLLFVRFISQSGPSKKLLGLLPLVIRLDASYSTLHNTTMY